MMFLRFTGLFACALAFAVSAEARPARGVPAMAGCPQGLYLNDGCIQAQTAGFGIFLAPSAYGSDFQTYATQIAGDGQTWISAHPQPKNVAGVDYPVGPTLPASALLDPEPAAAAVYAASHSYPTTSTGFPITGMLKGYSGGCIYYVGGAQSGYGDSVVCTQYTAGGPLTTPNGSYDVSGYDFSLHGCVALSFTAASNQSISVHNNRWVNGPGCNNTANANVGYFVKAGAASWIVVTNNWMDGQSRPTDTNCGGGPCLATGMIPISISGQTGNLSVTYNAAFWFSGRFVNSTVNTSGLSVTVSNNYVEGMTCAAPDPRGAGYGSIHGELADIAGNNPTTLASLVQDFNTVLLPSNCYYGNDITAPFWMGGPLSGFTAGGALHIIYAEVNDNTTINNISTIAGAAASPAHGRVMGTAISVDNYNNVDTFVSHGNFTDLGVQVGGQYGASLCYNLSAGNVVGSSDFGSVAARTANYSLRTGLPITGWGVGAGSAGCN